MGIWVGRYALVDGEVREHGPWLVDRQRDREEETLRLLVLTEPVDARSADACAEVAEAIAALFARESLSITGGLLRALQQAHGNLAEWNRRSLREHQLTVGVTCIVIREGDVTIAQAGPSLVYVAGPQGPTRLSTADTPAATPIGAAEPLEPRFTATTLPGREVLLLTTGAEEAVGQQQVEEALATGPERALADLFRRTREVPDMTAALVADLEIDEDAPPPAPLDVDEAVAGREVVLPGIDSGGRVPAPPDDDDDREPGRGPARRGGRNGQREGAAVPLPAIRRARTVGRRPQESQLPWRRIVLVAVVLAALALLVWAVGPGLLQEDRQAELEGALSDARTQMASAEAAERIDAQRTALQAVLAAAERARALAPEDPRVQDLETEANARLALLDAVTEVETLEPVITFDGTLTAPVTPLALAASDRALWMVETGRGRLFRIDLADPGSAVEVYRASTSYDGVTARDPVGITWDADAGRLLLLDAGRNLFAIADDGSSTPRPLRLRDSGELRSTGAMSAYLGNLYVLDPAAGEVWRYLPADGAFDSERTGILGNVEIDTASGLVVDGDVFVLDQSRLRRFRGGEESAPLLDGIDVGLQSPVAMVEDLLRGLFYIADRGNRRIVVAEREGAFVRQYRHADFADLRGLALSPDGMRLYLLTADGVSSFAITPPGQSSVGTTPEVTPEAGAPEAGAPEAGTPAGG